MLEENAGLRYFMQWAGLGANVWLGPGVSLIKDDLGWVADRVGAMRYAVGYIGFVGFAGWLWDNL